MLTVKRERDWMDWVQTGSAVYAARAAGVLAQAVEDDKDRQAAIRAAAREAETKNLPEGITHLPENLQNVAFAAQIDAQWHAWALRRGRGGDESISALIENESFKADCAYRESAWRSLAAQAGRPIYNLYDSLAMYRETVDSEFRRAADPWENSNVRFAAEAANRFQLHCFSTTLPEDQRRDFWEWQRFMMCRHYMRSLRGVAADNYKRGADTLRRQSLTLDGIVISMFLAAVPAMFVYGFVTSPAGGDSKEAQTLGLVLAFVAFVFISSFLSQLFNLRRDKKIPVHPKPVLVVSQFDGEVERRSAQGSSDTIRTPEIARQIGWLTAAGYLDPGSEPGNLDTDEMRRRMQTAAASWSRKPIMRAYVAARKAYRRELSFDAQRRQIEQGFSDLARNITPDELQKVLTSGIPIGDAKYLPPGPGRDLAMKYADSVRNRLRL